MTARRAFPVLTLVLFSLFTASAFAQTTYTWNQTGTASYATAANWTPTRTTPAANDVLVFNNGATTTATGVPAQTIGQLMVSGNTNVTLQAAAANTLTIAGGTGTDLSVAAGSQLNANTATALTVALGAAATGSINGSMTYSQGGHRLTAAAASGITFQSGSTFTAGTGFTGNAFGTTSLNSVVFASGSTFVFIAGANPFGAGQPSSVVVFQAGSLYSHQGSGAPAFSGRTYANFELNVAATISPTGGSAVSIDNLTVTQGTLNFGMTGTPGHSIKGNISIAAAGTLNFNPAAAATLNLNGGAAQGITNAGTLTLNDADQTINVNNANGITLNSSVTFQQGVLQFTLGNITTGANTLTIGSGASVSRTSGHVIGQLRKDFAANGSKVFEVGSPNGYSPFTANVTAGTPGNITCAAVQGPQPNMNPATSIQRYWVLGASAGITADLTFQYLDPPDVAGNEALYKVYRVNGGVPTPFPGSNVNGGTNTGTVNGISAFSDWTIGELASGVPNLTVTDVSQAETNAGTTFTFQVNLDSPAGPGGVTFDIATADGTAQDDNPAVSEDNDYVGQSLTGQTIASGNSSFAFNVTVNGDVAPETNETFFVNVTNVTGATITDGQGQGTIQNDDTACADLTISDVTQDEGTGGSTTFAFTVSLSQAGCGTVTFDIATADGTAQDDNPATEDNDYVPQSLTGQTVAFGTPYTFNVSVNPDAVLEADQTFFVNITNVSPANVQVTDGQGLGTIVNDDFTRIHDIQGNGNTSPLSGVVTTRGIVTGRKSNGYFIQEPDASVDADPMTSEGVFVFTSAAPPAAAAVGNYVEVTGTIAEFIPSADLLQPPLTELTSPTTVQLTTGNPLPAPIPLTPTFPDPAGPFDQLERLEGMRVSVASLTTSSPTLGNSTNEPNATQTSNGVFNGTVTGVPRPAREPGIQDPDPAPSGGSIPPIPRFDANPEMIRVDSDGLVGAPILDVDSLTTVTGLVGPLDYGFRHYTILPDPTLPAPIAAGGISPTSATAATSKEFTVAGYNVERFFDTVNDPGIGEPVLTAGAYDNRLNKLSIGIRNHLLFPDIIGMVEVENLSTLQDIATRVNNDAVANAQPNPLYTAHLIEGNDIGGIDVGFLVKTAIVTGATPRVTVNAVVQENDGELFVNADASTETLNDRPPLRLDAVVNAANGASFPVTVIVVHQRSLIGVNDESAGSSGWPTVGARVRAKRQAQANSLATLIQNRQTSNPAENIILVGDFNAYEFNDGLADTMNTVHGTPPPDNQTAVPGDGADLVNPDLDNLFDTPPPGDRYSYVFDGQMQNIDHGIVNAALIAATTARRIEHPRINTDFRAVDRNNASTARHLSDHDPFVTYFEVNGFAAADVSLTKTLDTVGPYFEGQSVTYTINVANAGPDPATNIQVTDTPTNLSITSVTGSGCSSLPCTIPSLAVGANTNITVTATIGSPGAFDNSATADADESDPNTGNNTGNDGDTAAASADVSVTKTLDTAGPYYAGNTVTFTINVANAGPSTATNISVTDTPTNLTITGVSGACTSFSPCTVASLASGANTNITVTATIDAAGAFDNSASATATENDPNGADNTDNDGDTALASADVSVTKTLDTAGPYSIGQSVTYTIVVANAGPSTATNIQVTDTPANLTITGVSGACAAFPCAIASLASGASTNITVTATIDSSGSFSNTATANADEFDPDTNDNSSTDTDVASQTNVVEVTKTVSGTFVQGTNITYTVVMTNTMTVNQPDNFGHEFTDILPAGLTLLPGSFTATSGTTGSVSNIFFWDGAIPTGGTVTLTFDATISATASGQICNQGQSIFDKDGDGQNEASELTDDPGTVPVNDPTCFNVVQANVVEVTKAVSGTFVQGTNITYTIVLTNNMTVTQPDNFGHEFTDNLPAGLTLVPASFTATSGTTGSVANIFFWDGAIPSAGTVTLTFQATISPTASGQICNQGQSIFDRNGDGQNEASELTDDPSTGANNDATCFYVVQSNVVETTKAVSGSFVQGTNVTFSITMTNNMTVTQPDQFGHEWTDILPSGLTLIPASITASSGTTGSVSNIVFWDGSIPSGGTVTLSFQATIGASATGTICNQGQSIFDRNGDGQNEAEEKTDDPSTGADDDPTCFTVIPLGIVSATKSASGIFTPGSTVTYTIVVTNNMGIAQANNAGDELTDVLPPSLTLINATATSGTATPNVGTNTVTWNGSLAAGASVTITITATINVGASGAVSNQATLAYDADGNGSNEAAGVSDDPSTGTANDPTVFNIVPPGEVSGTKSVTGSFVPGGAITYTIVLTNNMSIAQPNNPGDEFTDVLPASLTLVSASATSGTAVATVGTNTVTWNGSLAAGASVTITINATIDSDVAPGTTIANQGTISYDADGNGTNESTGQTDSASAPGGADDPTIIVVAAATLNHIPTLDQWALIALAMAMAAFAAMKLRA